jgi:hypothetical protein
LAPADALWRHLGDCKHRPGTCMGAAWDMLEHGSRGEWPSTRPGGLLPGPVQRRAGLHVAGPEGWACAAGAATRPSAASLCRPVVPCGSAAAACAVMAWRRAGTDAIACAGGLLSLTLSFLLSHPLTGGRSILIEGLGGAETRQGRCDSRRLRVERRRGADVRASESATHARRSLACASLRRPGPPQGSAASD